MGNRMDLLFDEQSFTSLGGEGTSVLIGCGTVWGETVFAFMQDKSWNHGAVGPREGALICRIYELAARMGAPVVGIYDSDGLTLEHQHESLAAYGDILCHSNGLSGVVPQISVVCGPCGGTAAMIAAGADFTVMTRQAELFSTPVFTTGQAGSESADRMMEAGAVHLVCADDKEALAAVRSMLLLLPQNNLAPAPVNEADYDTARAAGIAPGMAPADIARALCDDSVLCELQAGFGESAFTALGSIGGMSCGLVAAGQGALTLDDCTKLGRFMSICDAFSLPLLTILDSEGFDRESGGGMLRATAFLAHTYAEATTPKLTLITGQAIGSAYIALAGKNAGADITYAWENAVVSALPPDAAVTLLAAGEITAERPRAEVVAEYKAGEGSAQAALISGGIDAVIATADTRERLRQALDLLSGKRQTRLPKKHSSSTR